MGSGEDNVPQHHAPTSFGTIEFLGVAPDH